MCGISGIYNFNSSHDLKNVLSQMNQSLVHRGPDAGDIWFNNNIGLAHRRLSIIDRSSSADQPMVSHNNKYIIVYNGEIYNFVELRNTLIARGIIFKTNSDTEVLLEGLAEFGLDFVSQLNGIFAFAIYDLENHKIHLCRDRFGVKPLFYSLTNKNELIFASEIKAILASNVVNCELSLYTLPEYFHYGSSLGEETFYKGIKSLIPGCILSFDSFNTSINYFYNINSLSYHNDDLISIHRNIADLTDRSVRSQLVSDVPIGIFLSSGIDSSIIALLASRYSKSIDTFTCDFEGTTLGSEVNLASKFSKHIGLRNHRLNIQFSDIPDLLQNVIDSFDQPFADPAALAINLMTQKVKDSVGVILQGDGGDELFAGYKKYTYANNYNIISKLAYLLPLLQTVIPKNSRFYRSLRIIDSFKDDHNFISMVNSQIPYKFDYKKIFNPEVFQLDCFRLSNEHYNFVSSNFSSDSIVQRFFLSDLSILLPDIYFPKVDRMSMRNSVEVRVPFIDNDLVDYSFGIRPNYKFNKKFSKPLLRHAFEQYLPDYILHQNKIGFNVPIRDWIKGPLYDFIRDVLLDDSILNNLLFNFKNLERLLISNKMGKEDHGLFIYKLTLLVLWFRSNNLRI